MLQCAWMPSGRGVPMLLLVAVLAGCAGPGERRDSPAQISDPVGEAVDPRTPGEAGSGTTGPLPPTRESPQEAPAEDAASSLVEAALRARSAGDAPRAVALLERAQRIDPDNGRLYLELARAHFDAGNTAQGRATAERGLLYCRREECAALRALIE